jgi:hypothetical protein
MEGVWSGMVEVESVQGLMQLKHEIDALVKKSNRCKVFFNVAVIGSIIAFFVFLSTEIKYDLIPIDKTAFDQYSLSMPISMFVQAKMASIEDVFTITTYTKGLSPWTDMYKYDSEDLTDSSASTYEELQKRYNSIADQSSYSYMYTVGKTEDQKPCILRMSGEDAEGLNKYVEDWETLLMASYGLKAAVQPVYGRAVRLTPLSELENKELLTAKDSDFFSGRPAGMKDDAYYRQLETYPVINLEDVAAYDKRANAASVTNHNIALAVLLLLVSSVVVLRVILTWIRSRFETNRKKFIQLASQMGIGQIKA